jgi:hypothetical protein
MAFKFRIGNFIIINLDKDAAADPAYRIEEHIERLESQLDSKVKNWFKNDRVFDWLRNTYARVALILLTWVTLFGFGYLAFNSESLTIWYVLSLVVLGAMHQLSVRHVFSSSSDSGFSFRVASVESDDFLDEYQRARRDRAFRGAYRNLGSVVFALFTAYLVYLVWQSSDAAGSLELPAVLIVDFQLSASQVIVLAAGVVGFYSLQKYIAWGFKGEPLNSRNKQAE